MEVKFMKMKNAMDFIYFYESIANENMPIDLAYKLMKIVNNLQQDRDFYTTELNKIFEDCVVKEDDKFKLAPDKQQFVLKDGKKDEFEKRANELQDIEVKFDERLKLDIQDFKGVSISPKNLTSIQEFFK